MLRTVDFVVVLDDGVRKRHRHQAESGKISNFSVQLEVVRGGEWTVVRRYDCAHGDAHVHRYDIMGRVIKTMLRLSFESALTFADWDINENWRSYVQKFLGGKI